MNKDINFQDLNEYINLIHIESDSKIGLYKVQSTQHLLQKFKSTPKLLHEDWQVMDLNSKFKQNSYGMFRIGIYINNIKKSLVIALAGTKNTHDLKPNLEILSGKIPERFKKLNNFLDIYLSKNIREFYQNLGYKFIFTGHSLGGFLAQLSYIKCKSETPSFEAKVISFDSPGAKKQATQLLYKKYRSENYSSLQSKNLALALLESSDYKEKIINIIRRFNIINTSGKQIGSYLWLAESYFKLYRFNRLKLITDVLYHRLRSFSQASQNPERYDVYLLEKPSYKEAILLKPAENNPQNILLNIKEIQENNNSKEIFHHYISNVLKAKSPLFYNSTRVIQQEESIIEELHHCLETLHDHGFEFIDRSNPITKILDMIKRFRGKKKSLDKKDDNILIINNILQKIQNSNFPSLLKTPHFHPDSLPHLSQNPSRTSIQTRD